MKYGSFFAKNLFHRILPGMAMVPLNLERSTPSPGSQGSNESGDKKMRMVRVVWEGLKTRLEKMEQ